MLEKTLTFVGATDEEVAHLRLLLRRAAPRLDCQWRWATHESADLLVVKPVGLPAESARAHAAEQGSRCIVVGSEAEVAPLAATELRLDYPFQLDAVVAALNEPVRASVVVPAVTPMSGDELFNDLYETTAPTFDPNDLPDFPDEIPVRRQPPGWDESEALFRRDPLASSPQVLLPGALDMRTGVEYTQEATARTEARIADRPVAENPFAEAGSPNIDPALRRRAPPDRTSHPLSAYLDDELLLGGPSRLEMTGAPPLVLDPKQRHYHAAQDLDALAAYARRKIRRDEWQPVTSQELTELRARTPGKPYERLKWLEVLLGSQGRLASHLDPGGTYKLKRWFEVPHAYPQHYRISRAMLRPMRLHELAATSRATMEEVFELVSAYDAIGLLEHQVRERLRAGPESTGAKSGG